MDPGLGEKYNYTYLVLWWKVGIKIVHHAHALLPRSYANHGIVAVLSFVHSLPTKSPQAWGGWIVIIYDDWIWFYTTVQLLRL